MELKRFILIFVFYRELSRFKLRVNSGDFIHVFRTRAEIGGNDGVSKYLRKTSPNF